jgi:hypothetical protein
LLEVVPLPDGSFVLSWGDLETATELAGAKAPAPGDVDALLEWAQATASPSGRDVSLQLPEGLGATQLASHDEVVAEFGFGLWDARGFAELSSPPLRYTAIAGTMDAAAIDAAIGPAADGVWSIGGADYELDLEGRTPARPIGQPVRLAFVAEGTVAVSTHTPALEGILDGLGTRAADDAQLAGIAEALDARGAYTGMVLRNYFGGVFEGVPAAFSMLGVGLASIGGEARVIAVYAHADEDAAAENAAAIPGLIHSEYVAEVLTVAETVAEGTLVIAEFTVGDVPLGAVWNLPMARAGVFAHR